MVGEKVKEKEKTEHKPTKAEKPKEKVVKRKR
jgi:hypothetical protein